MFSTIKEITFKISSYCNLDCVYCFQTGESKARDSRFALYDELAEFMAGLPLAERVEVKLTGGEASLFPDDICMAYKKLKKVEKYADTRLHFTTITNGSNLEVLLALMKEGILDPWGCKVSWDGLYSASKSRRPKDKAFDDAFFNDKIRLLGASGLGDEVLVRMAVTPDTVDSLCASLVFCLDHGCTKWEYYFLTDCEDYRTPEFAAAFKAQIRLIAAEYNRRPFNYYNWDTLAFTELVLPKDDKTRLRSIGCRHLGRSLYVAENGDVYPCGFFYPDSVYGFSQYKLGNIKDGFRREVVEKFIGEYLAQPMCDWQQCANLHCFECPALTKYRTGHMNHKLCQACDLRDIERQVFHATQRLDIDPAAVWRTFDYAQEWSVQPAAAGRLWRDK
ncbi:MAG: SPASM domain-containing protein [Negativicutes bacterium]|nr:SPASM domain-containing protein [Negativicutes bacterium]